MDGKKRAWTYCRIDAPEDAHGSLKGQKKELFNVLEKVAALLNHCYPDQPELKNDGQQEGGPNPDQQNSPVMG